MNNNLDHLNEQLFAQLQRINAVDISDEQLKKEITRSKAVTSVATQIINNARLSLDAQKALPTLLEQQKLPKMLT